MQRIGIQRAIGVDDKGGRDLLTPHDRLDIYGWAAITADHARRPTGKNGMTAKAVGGICGLLALPPRGAGCNRYRAPGMATGLPQITCCIAMAGIVIMTGGRFSPSLAPSRAGTQVSPS